MSDKDCDKDEIPILAIDENYNSKVFCAREADNSTFIPKKHGYVKTYYFWIFFSIALIFGLIVWSMINTRLSSVSVAGVPLSQLFTPVLMIVFVLIALFGVSFAAFQAAKNSERRMSRLVGNTFFIVTLFVFLLWAYLLVTPGFVNQAFWTSVVLVIIAVLWVLWSWKISRGASYFMIIVALIFAYLAFYTNQVRNIVA
jgi:hypothetical protein